MEILSDFSANKENKEVKSIKALIAKRLECERQAVSIVALLADSQSNNLSENKFAFIVRLFN